VVLEQQRIPDDLVEVANAQYASRDGLASGSQEAQDRQRQAVAELGLPLEVKTAKTGMVLRWVPAGSFTMGSPTGEANRSDDETQHQVTLSKPFYCGKYEVTQAQYRAVMGTNPSYFKGGNNPVEKVRWNNAMDFCRKLSERTGKNYNLPTEAQWEYACRAGTTTAYSMGNNADQLMNYAWYSSNSGTFGLHHPVGHKQPNAWGLYDMHGNVWEWCLSLYMPYPYSETDGRNSLSDTTSARVLRGGSYGGAPPATVRCAYRYNQYANTHDRFIGFRCARTP
jgi:formylglycine-generating enzyme required for sulfatase activity